MRGYDAGKKVSGRKRHIAVDTLGFILALHVSAASLHDSHGAEVLLGKMGRRQKEHLPRLEEIVADSAYAGDRLATTAYVEGCWDIVIVRRSEEQKGFVLQKVRWIVERTFAWLNSWRRLALDLERYTSTMEAFIFFRMANLLARRLAKLTQK
jgi:putative transposase